MFREGDQRNLWKSARERNRMKARRAIRHRVLNNNNDLVSTSSSSTEQTKQQQINDDVDENDNDDVNNDVSLDHHETTNCRNNNIEVKNKEKEYNELSSKFVQTMSISDVEIESSSENSIHPKQHSINISHLVSLPYYSSNSSERQENLQQLQPKHIHQENYAEPLEGDMGLVMTNHDAVSIKTRESLGKTKTKTTTKTTEEEKKITETEMSVAMDIETNRRQLVQTILYRIIVGNNAYFSLQWMVKNYTILSIPLPIEYVWNRKLKENQEQNTIESNIPPQQQLWWKNNEKKEQEAEKQKEVVIQSNHNSQTPIIHQASSYEEDVTLVKNNNDNNNELIGECRLLSWFLYDRLYQLKQFLLSLQTFTIMEYTIWFHKYHITSNLLLGGINPCIRGTFIRSPFDADDHDDDDNADINNYNNSSQNQNNIDNDELTTSAMNNSYLSSIGQIILKRFFDGVPLTLSTYISKRVVDMRITSSIIVQSTSKQQQQNQQQQNTNKYFCSCCQQYYNDPNQMLCYIPHNNSNNDNNNIIFHCYDTLMKNTIPQVNSDSDACKYDSTKTLHELNEDATPTSTITHHEKSDNIIPIDNDTYCYHQFCEACLWKDILQHIDNARYDENIVRCPICHMNNTQNNHDTNMNVNGDNEYNIATAKDRANQSLHKFVTLPMNTTELKRFKKKIHKLSEKEFICSTWKQSILRKSSLGLTQEVRTDKFFSYIEQCCSRSSRDKMKIQNDNDDISDNPNTKIKQSSLSSSTSSVYLHYIQGCIDEGIDINFQNEYGQTAVYRASWYGQIKLVQLLLHYGADPNIYANGYVTCLDVAQAHQHDTIVHLLHEVDGTFKLEQVQSIREFISIDNNSTMKEIISEHHKRENEIIIQEVIDRYMNHPGSGSFIIDHVVPNDMFIQSILDLWKILPYADDMKKKMKKNNNIPCSIRSYFCDAEGWITQHIYNAIQIDTFKNIQSIPNVVINHRDVNDDNDDDKLQQKQHEDIIVFPHMRFLYYSQPGTMLAPHIDLCRSHPVTGQRSTHSFLYYLTDCYHGGETVLLHGLSDHDRTKQLATIQPKSNRLLLFPHQCPHEGIAVIDVPKILIRGELYLPSSYLYDDM